MKNTPSTKKLEEPFSPAIFVSVNLATFAVYVGLLVWLAPNSFHVLSGTWWMWYAVIFAAMSLFNGFAEGFFHKFTLHLPLISFFRVFYEKHHHIHHHKHTPVIPIPIEGMPLVVEVRSRYYIVEPEQHEASSFPHWTLAVFLGIVSSLLLWFQIRFPNQPILFASGSAVVCSLMFYELIHAAFHKPIDWWYPKLKHPVWGKFWTRIYGHHLNHHVSHLSNYNVFGFFTIAVFDIAFGTRVKNTALFIDGTEVCPTSFRAPRPFWTLRILNWFARLKLKLDHRLK